MEDCVFCKIAAKTLGSDILFENESVMAVRDILPRAPVHIQIFPKKHIPSLNDITQTDSGLVADMVLVAKELAQKAVIADRGYKMVINVGKEGGQVIQHLHLHLMGGKQLEE